MLAKRMRMQSIRGVCGLKKQKFKIIIISSILIVFIICGLILLFLDKQQIPKNDSLIWFNTESAAVNHARKEQISGVSLLLKGTNYVHSKKAIPVYFKNKKDGEGFVVIVLEKKGDEYAPLLNGAGAAVSYPPGLSEGQEVVPGIIFKLDKKHRYILYFGKNKNHSKSITLNGNKKIVPLYVKNTDIYYRLESY